MTDLIDLIDAMATGLVTYRDETPADDSGDVWEWIEETDEGQPIN